MNGRTFSLARKKPLPPTLLTGKGTRMSCVAMTYSVVGIRELSHPSSSMLVNQREQGKMEETGCEIICGAPTTLAVKG